MLKRGSSVGVLALAAALGCKSEPLDAEACPDVGAQSQPFKGRCLARAFDPITDAANPNYGRVGCQMIAAWSANAPECSCDAPGYAPANQAEREFAAAQLADSQACESVPSPDYCFCEFLQHHGDELAACQSRPSEGTYDGGPTGWCYVEPALGLGSAEDVADCPAEQKRKIRYFPDDDSRFSIWAVIRCVGQP